MKFHDICTSNGSGKKIEEEKRENKAGFTIF